MQVSEETNGDSHSQILKHVSSLEKSCLHFQNIASKFFSVMPQSARDGEWCYDVMFKVDESRISVMNPSIFRYWTEEMTTITKGYVLLQQYQRTFLHVQSQEERYRESIYGRKESRRKSSMIGTWETLLIQIET